MIEFLKSIKKSLFYRFTRKRLMDTLSYNPCQTWPLIEGVWSRSTGIYRTRIGASGRMPFELTVLQYMLETEYNWEDVLWKHLSHPNPHVCAYCLIGLEKIKSEKLKELPEDLLGRTDPIKIHVGSFIMIQTLGDFAKQISKPIQYGFD